MNHRRMKTAAGAALLALALLGCSNGEDAAQLSAQAVPDFGLQDVNPGSPTSGSTVSVRDFVGAVSGWYFAYAT